MDLVAIVAVSLLLLPLVAFASGIPRIILGLAVVLFFPGYALLSALFPRKSSLDNAERIALSFGLSIAIVPLIGLVLNWTPWRINLYPALLSLLLFIILMALLAWYRRRSINPEERFSPQLNLRPSSISRWWSPQSRWDKALTVMLAVAIIAPAGTITYVIANPKVGTQLTEFYILGPEGEADGYPQEFVLKEGKVARVKYFYADPARIPRVETQGKVMVVVVNQERQTLEYKVEIIIEGEKMGEGIAPFTLLAGQRSEREVVISPTQVGSSQKVEFWLYRSESSEPYRTLVHWIDVVEQ